MRANFEENEGTNSNILSQLMEAKEQIENNNRNFNRNSALSKEQLMMFNSSQSMMLFHESRNVFA